MTAELKIHREIIKETGVDFPNLILADIETFTLVIFESLQSGGIYQAKSGKVVFSETLNNELYLTTFLQNDNFVE